MDHQVPAFCSLLTGRHLKILALLDEHRVLTTDQTMRTRRIRLLQLLGIHPDAHGLGKASGTLAGWFLECDVGTGSLPRSWRISPPTSTSPVPAGRAIRVLFWLSGAGRRANLHRHAPVVPFVEPLTDRGLPVAGNPNWIDGRLDLSEPDRT